MTRAHTGHAMRGAPEDAADAKIDSFVKDNKARVGVRGDARAIDATHAGHALHERDEDLPPVRLLEHGRADPQRDRG